MGISYTPRWTILARIAAAVLVLSASGCITPVVVRPNLIAVGMFSLQSVELSSAGRYDRLAGFGAVLGDGLLSVGAIERERIVIEPTPEGVFVETSRVSFMTGRLAEVDGPGWLLGELGMGSSVQKAGRQHDALIIEIGDGT